MPIDPAKNLYRRLAMSPVPILPELRAALPSHQDLNPALARPADLHRLASRPSTDLSTLRAVKAFAKSRYALCPRQRADERRVYLAVYLVAIAAGLKWHQTYISRLSLDHLADALKWVSSQTWLPASTRRLCASAWTPDPIRRADRPALWLFETERTP